MMSIEIAQMQPSDRDEAAEVLSRAMLNNPILVAVYLGESERERVQIKAQFRNQLLNHPEEVFLAKRGHQIIGVCRSYICHGNRPISKEVIALFEAKDIDLPKVEDRDRYWKGIWRSRDPSKVHSHLGPIGVLPEFQSVGVGTRLMENYCRLVDERKLPAYLETDKIKNIRFYEQFGFQLVDEVDIFGVKNYFLWRDVCQ
jgi:ribosomal protein S18 acetylase RimI-like enzyme